MKRVLEAVEAGVFWLIVAWGVLSLVTGIVAMVWMEWSTALGQAIAVLVCLVLVPSVRFITRRKRYHRELLARAEAA